MDKDIRILVVDDFEAVANTLKLQLRRLGFNNIDAVTTGAAAMEKIRANKDYQLILSDWNMNDVTGLELLAAVRADEKLAKVPFIMVTGNANREQIVAAKQA